MRVIPNFHISLEKKKTTTVLLKSNKNKKNNVIKFIITLIVNSVVKAVKASKVQYAR